MQLAGTASWRLSAGGSQACELALFARDVAQLPTGSEVPALTGAAVAVTQGVDAATRRAAGEQWGSWWQQVLEFEVQDRLHRTGAQGRERARQALDRLRRVCDPSEFDALADRPMLRCRARDLGGLPAVGVSTQPSG